ncbi:MAG: flagellum-specific ATP synthase FliI, partial [Nitrospirae bacterium]
MKLDTAEEVIKEIDPVRVFGKVSEITGLVIKARGLKVSVGDACRIYRDDGGITDAEVVGFKGPEALLMAIGPTTGIRPGSPV